MHLDYIKDNEKIYRTITGGNLDDNIKMKIFRNMLSDLNAKMPEWCGHIENPYVQKFIISGCGSTIFQWINNCFDMETRDLAKLIYNLCKKATS